MERCGGRLNSTPLVSADPSPPGSELASHQASHSCLLLTLYSGVCCVFFLSLLCRAPSFLSLLLTSFSIDISSRKSSELCMPCQLRDCALCHAPTKAPKTESSAPFYVALYHFLHKMARM